MALVVQRNPRGNGYIIVDDSTGEQYGATAPGGGVYSSAQAAQDQVDAENAWREGGRQPTPEEAAAANERLRQQMEQNAADQASASDPEAQRERMDSGQSRSGGYYDPYADDGAIPQWVKDTQGIPLIGGPADAWMADYEARRNESGWDGLSDFMPTPDDLAVTFEEDAGVAAGWTPERAAADGDAIAAQDRALAGLTDFADNGGLTAADRARMQLGEMEVGRSMRSSREADLAALQARGMGGSGAEVASMLGAQQAGADGLFRRDAEIQMHAEDRAMDALAGLGSLGSQQRGQSFDESAWNAGQSNDYNRWNTDYDRERSRWNTEQRSKTNQSRSDARQQSYENRERQQAGKTNQWQSAAGGRREDAARNDENAKDVAGGIAGALEELFG